MARPSSISDCFGRISVVPASCLGYSVAKPQKDEADMTETTRQKPSRSVIARRTLALGTTIATAALGTGAIAGSDVSMATNADQSLFHFVQDSTADMPPLAGGNV